MNYSFKTSKFKKNLRIRAIIFLIFSLALFCVAYTALSLQTYWSIPMRDAKPFSMFFKNFISSEFSQSKPLHLPDLASDLKYFSRTSLQLDFPEHEEFEAWNLESKFSDVKSRNEEISRFFLRGKLHFGLQAFQGKKEGIFFLNEPLQNRSHSAQWQKVVPLLPGESLQWNFEDKKGMTQSFYVRCLGATIDRLDAEIKLKVVIDDEKELEFAISPKGELQKIVLPNLKSSTIKFHWKQDSPGILAFLGNERPKNDRTDQAGTLLVTIDNIPETEHFLPQTTAVLSEHYSKENLVLLNGIWPLSPSYEANTFASFMGKHPADLGITLPTAPINIGEFERTFLEERLKKVGLHLTRVNLGNGVECHQADCFKSGSLKNVAALGRFDTVYELEREKELRSAGKLLFSKPLAMNNTFIHANIRFPEEKLSLTWKTASDSKLSLFGWLKEGTIAKIFSKPSTLNFYSEEKLAQLDALLVDLVSASVRSGQKPNIIILTNDYSDNNSNDFLNNTIRPGKILLASTKLKSSHQAVRTKSSIYSQVGLRKFILSMHDINDTNEQSDSNFDPVSVFEGEKAKKNVAIVQSSKGELFVFEKGSLFLPSLSPEDMLKEVNIKGAESMTTMPLFQASESLTEIQQLRRSYTHQTLNFSLPPSDQDSKIDWDFEVRTSFKWKKCFSNGKVSSMSVGPSEKSRNSVVHIRMEGKKSLPTRLTCLVENDKGRSRMELSAFRRGIPISPTEMGLGQFAARHLSDKAIEETKVTLEGGPLDELKAEMPPLLSAFKGTPLFIWIDSFPKIDESMHPVDVTFIEQKESMSSLKSAGDDE